MLPPMQSRPPTAAPPRRPRTPGALLLTLALLLTACADPPRALDAAVADPSDAFAPDPNDDAPPPDAIADAMADATLDAAPDTALDATLDATPDAIPDTSLDATPDATDSPDALPDALPDAAPPPCPDPPGARCNPILIDTFPTQLNGDTTHAPEALIDTYACAPDTPETGGEIWHVIDIPTEALLTATLDDQPGDATDIDLHLLPAPDPDTCPPGATRANITLTRYLTPGRWWLIADTWTGPDAIPRAGPYQLNLDLTPLDGPCAFEARPLRMHWPDCDPTIDCYTDPDTGDTLLRTPAYGPIVKEAHLVTQAEPFPQGWPIAARDGIDNHYAISQQATAYAMNRREPWAPAGEGGSEWGQSATARPLPVIDEAWYVTQYWRDRPPPGTRLIVLDPTTHRAVVTAGGYETGPGSNTAVAGASEETHHHLGTTHRDPLLIGFARDQTLPLGPINCFPR